MRKGLRRRVLEVVPCETGSASFLLALLLVNILFTAAIRMALTRFKVDENVIDVLLGAGRKTGEGTGEITAR